jgi:hypothetical protein
LPSYALRSKPDQEPPAGVEAVNYLIFQIFIFAHPGFSRAKSKPDQKMPLHTRSGPYRHVSGPWPFGIGRSDKPGFQCLSDSRTHKLGDNMIFEDDFFVDGF